jgi:hypothetical protein
VFGINKDREQIKHNIKHVLCVRKSTLISENKEIANRGFGSIYRLSYTCTHTLLVLGETR